MKAPMPETEETSGLAGPAPPSEGGDGQGEQVLLSWTSRVKLLANPHVRSMVMTGFAMAGAALALLFALASGDLGAGRIVALSGIAIAGGMLAGNLAAIGAGYAVEVSATCLSPTRRSAKSRSAPPAGTSWCGEDSERNPSACIAGRSSPNQCWKSFANAVRPPVSRAGKRRRRNDARDRKHTERGSNLVWRRLVWWLEDRGDLPGPDRLRSRLWRIFRWVSARALPGRTPVPPRGRQFAKIACRWSGAPRPEQTAVRFQACSANRLAGH
jgi:hypothetical protein